MAAMGTMMRAELAAVVIGGTLEAIGSVPPPPPAFHVSQLDALPRVLPRDFVPADLVAREALQQAAAEQCQATAGPAAAPAATAAAGAVPLLGEEGALDCLEACCLQDDLHLFRYGFGSSNLRCVGAAACLRGLARRLSFTAAHQRQPDAPLRAAPPAPLAAC